MVDLSPIFYRGLGLIPQPSGLLSFIQKNYLKFTVLPVFNSARESNLFFKTQLYLFLSILFLIANTTIL